MNIQDNEVIILNGVEYIRKEEKKTLPSEVKFEIGKWYSSETYDTIIRITNVVDTEKIYYDDNTNKVQYFINGSLFSTQFRIATPAEIESRLRKICEERYVGKMVECVAFGEHSRVKPTIRKFNYYDNKDECWVLADKIRVCLYNSGKWATIIPDKKPVPKTREEFDKFQDDWCELTRSNVTWEKFLDQYDFNE